MTNPVIYVRPELMHVFKPLRIMYEGAPVKIEEKPPEVDFLDERTSAVMIDGYN